jgi:hypothetical protein
VVELARSRLLYGEWLFISPGTVEYHLHKVFPKLGISLAQRAPKGAPGRGGHCRARLARQTSAWRTALSHSAWPGRYAPASRSSMRVGPAGTQPRSSRVAVLVAARSMPKKVPIHPK